MPKWAKHGLGMLWLVSISLLLPLHSAAAPLQPTPSSATGVLLRANGSMILSPSAPTPPTSFASFSRFGLFDSAITTPAAPFTQARITFRATAPAGTAVHVAARGRSVDGRWGAWQTELITAQTVQFERVMQQLQYRVVLLGGRTTTPEISAVQLQPNAVDRSMQMDTSGSSVAPTYRLRVTRQGMVGGRTANGHIITKNDVFVSLPSWSSLSSKGGREYQVRLSANGKSVIAPVYDVGPWNHNDNYWDAKRKTYKDLPTGWPQDHAAYYENHNRRMADEGWVRFPTAVDIGDGAYWALGLKGAQATVDVTFLWLGKDPGANPKPRNSSPSERPSGTRAEEPDPAATPPEQVQVEAGATGFDANTADWQQATCGTETIARWLPGTADGKQAALWRPILQGGKYQVAVHVPRCAGFQPSTKAANYLVHSQDGREQTVLVNQAAEADDWVVLGEFNFAPGSDGFIKLSTAVDDPGNAVWFDAVRWVRVE